MSEYTCELDEDAIVYCRDRLNETEENKIKCLKETRKWLEENSHINAYTDTYSLLMFLRTSKYNMEETKKKIESFYNFKATTPEWYEKRDPLLPEIQSLLKTGPFLPLRKRDKNGRLVVLIRPAAHDPDVQAQNDVFKVGIMAVDLALKEEDTMVYGITAIFDMHGITQGHASALSINMIRKAVTSWQVYPVRIKTMDFINSPTYINVVLNIFRTFMTAKLKGRVHVHGDSQESLHKIVPKEILPFEYGGTDSALQDLIDYWHQRVTDARDWFLEDEKHKALINSEPGSS